MKIQAVHREAGQMQRFIIEEFYLSDTGNPKDRFIRGDWVELQPDAGIGIQGNPAAARIQDKTQAVREVVQLSLYQHDSASEYNHGKGGEQLGRRPDKRLLPGERITPKEKDSRPQENPAQLVLAKHFV
jgi:hypothetical protein